MKTLFYLCCRVTLIISSQESAAILSDLSIYMQVVGCITLLPCVSGVHAYYGIAQQVNMQ